MFRVVRHLACGAAALAAATNVAAAQSLVPVTRNQFGISATLIRPTGEFQRFVDWGGGLGMYFVAGMDTHGILGIRVDGSALWYGHESWDIWLGPRLPYSYLRASTDNMIFSLGVGPQVTFGTGRVRPYGFGTAGLSYFVTWSSVSGVDGYDYESNTNFDDMSFALSAGGGLLTQIAGRNKPVFLDIAAHWTHNGTTDYLREGSIIDAPDGSMIMLPIRSEANHWSFRLGVTFAF